MQPKVTTSAQKLRPSYLHQACVLSTVAVATSRAGWSPHPLRRPSVNKVPSPASTIKKQPRAPQAAMGARGVYHDGELAVQQREGTAEQAAHLAGMVRPLVNQQLSLFTEQRSDVIAASADSEGRLWASMLFGAPGFIRVTPDAAALLVGADNMAAVSPTDPLHNNALADGAALGFLFIEMHTRRRNRINGVSRPARASSGGLFVQVQEAFGNCPKYITRRALSPPSQLGGSRQGEAPPMRSRRLTSDQQRLIAEADMMFVATASPGGGADASHRGGSPGFVRVLDERTLVWPDYTGNGMFMTLGNLQLNPAAGLLFVDWAAHSLLQLTGHARVLFEDDIARRQLAPLLGGAERAVVFTLDEALHRSSSVPFDYRLLDYSPYNYPVPTTGSMRAPGKAEQAATLVGVEQITPLVKEFTFEAERALQYLPGQYAMFDLEVPRAGGAGVQRVTRSWTITSTAAPNKRTFSIAVKRLPGGRASTWLHDTVQLGASVRLVGTAGDFTPFSDAGLVAAPALLLLSAGIGVTPMLAMLRGLRAGHGKRPDVVALHTSRTAADVPFRSEMPVGANTDGIRFVENLTARDGRLTAERLQEHVPDVATRQVYLCGPTTYQTHVTALLEALGVPPGNIHTESFSY